MTRDPATHATAAQLVLWLAVAAAALLFADAVLASVESPVREIADMLRKGTV